DLRLGETRLTVRVVDASGARLEEAAQLVLLSAEGRRITGAYSPEDPEEEPQFVGMEHGEYTLTARTASGLTSAGPARAQLTAQRPEATATLVMGRHQGRLLVLDEQGQALPQAAARAGGRPLERSSAGVFPLGDVALGEWLTVQAEGYTPVCRILQARDLPEARVTLLRPTEGVSVHAPLQMAWESALLRGLPGSDCPVEIHDLGVSVQMEAERTSLALRLPPGRFELLLGGTASPLLAPGKDVVLATAAPGAADR
ncbi:MAG TPA: hypothetical protein VFO85_02615, partial [Vicinamibacteria bacterium]|nr:hypothetical protein [Vicinamibacteria bacterium]